MSYTVSLYLLSLGRKDKQPIQDPFEKVLEGVEVVIVSVWWRAFTTLPAPSSLPSVSKPLSCAAV